MNDVITSLLAQHGTELIYALIGLLSALSAWLMGHRSGVKQEVKKTSLNPPPRELE